MNETQVTMLGNAVEDPVLRFGKSGQPFVTFRLASTVRRRDPATGLFVDAGTNFVTVLAFRQLARNVAESVRKGQPVVVSGRLRVNQWSSGERTGTSVEIDAATVGHDLTRGVGRFTKVRGGTFGEGSFPADVPGLRLASDVPAGTAPAEPTDPEQDAELEAAYERERPYDDLDAPLPPYDEDGSPEPDPTPYAEPDTTPYAERRASVGA